MLLLEQARDTRQVMPAPAKAYLAIPVIKRGELGTTRARHPFANRVPREHYPHLHVSTIGVDAPERHTELTHHLNSVGRCGKYGSSDVAGRT